MTSTQTIQTQSDSIHVDDSALDIFHVEQRPAKSIDWFLDSTLPPYDQLFKAYLDIETTGLDPFDSELISVGMGRERGGKFLASCRHNTDKTREGELALIEGVWEWFKDSKPDCLYTYNGTSFDLPYLIRRWIILRSGGVQWWMDSTMRLRDFVDCAIKHRVIGKWDCPFWVCPVTTKNDTIQIYSKPLYFNQLYLKGCATLDVYHFVLQEDFVKRKLTSYTLKDVPIQWGLRKERRLDLGYEGILDCWKRGDWDELARYLIFDIEDTQLIANKLMPTIYTQKEFFPEWKFQKVAYKGNAAKWQRMMERYKGLPELTWEQKSETVDGVIEIGGQVYNYPTPDGKKFYQGAYTKAVAGLYPMAAKLDVGSMYPGNMRYHNIHSWKDSGGEQIDLLAALTDERLKLKKMKHDPIAQHRQGAMKILINSAYGMLGTEGIGFNDYRAAATVTAYGRAIAKWMERFIHDLGGFVFQIDTDGLFYYNPETPSYEWNREVFAKMKAALPLGITIDYEIEGNVFVPGEMVKGEMVAKKKNYYVYNQDGVLALTKGVANKRDRSILDRTFVSEFVKRYFQEKESAIDFYKDVRNSLMTNQYPVEKLVVRRKIRQGEKTLPQQLNAREGDVVSYYQWMKEYATLSDSGNPYCVSHYVDKVDRMYAETLGLIDYGMMEAFKAVRQLSLL